MRFLFFLFKRTGAVCFNLHGKQLPGALPRWPLSELTCIKGFLVLLRDQSLIEKWMPEIATPSERKSCLSFRWKNWLYLMEFDHDGPRLLFFFILLHFRLESLIILKSLFPAFYCHVQTGKHTAVPEHTQHRQKGKDHINNTRQRWITKVNIKLQTE